MVKIDKCNENFNTFDDLSSRVCILNKTEKVNLNVFNLVTGISESKITTKHISYYCKCKFEYKKMSFK